MKPKFTFIATQIDADEQFFFARELEFIKTKSYDVKYPGLKYREILPVSHEAGEGAETITYRTYDQRGMAKIVSNYANDFPRVDVVGSENTVKVKSLGDSYGYNVQEIRAARMAGKPLEQRRANAARKAIMEQENALAMFGNAQAGLVGFLNHPNIGEYLTPNDGTGTSTTFETKTAEQILRDLNAVANKIVTDTKGVEIPDTVLLPLSTFNYLSSKVWSQYSDQTILEVFKKNNQYIKNVGWLNELETAGDGLTKRMIAYRRDPDALTLEIPKEFETFPPQERGLDYVIHCHSRIGGVIIYYPLSVCYADGI